MTNVPGSRKPADLRGGQEAARRRAGMAVGCCLAVVAVVGCGASQSAGTASPQPQPRQSSRAVTAEVSQAGLKALAARYLAIARPANHRLEVEVDRYDDHERDDLAAAKKDLRAQAATELHFDGQLLQIRFPAWIAMTARALVSSNQVRIALTERQARSPSLPGLRSFDHRHQAADAAVETRVRLIRQFLGLPPPSTS